jgi:hypothetical protein
MAEDRVSEATVINTPVEASSQSSPIRHSTRRSTAPAGSAKPSTARP